MTGAGNNTYLLAERRWIGGPGRCRRRRACAPRRDRGGARGRDAQLRPVLVTHGHRDHAAGAPALAAAHPRRVRQVSWPEEDHRVPRALAADRRRRRDLASAASRSPFCTRPGTRRITWRSGTSRARTALHRRSRRPRQQRDDPLEPRRRPGAVPRLARAAAARSSPRGCCPRTVRRSTIRRRCLPATSRAPPDARAAGRVAALRAGRDTVQAIAESIYDGLAPALMPAAQENVRAHLEKLKAEGARRRRRPLDLDWRSDR